MKQFLMVLLTVFGLMFATSVVAETYTVRSGDTLGKIAKQYQRVSWQDIYYANKQKIKNPDRIYPRQKLDIPVRSKEPLIVYYDEPDSNPVGKGTDPVPYIKKAHLPKDVEEQFIVWAFTVDKGTLANAIITKLDNSKITKDKRVFSHFDTMGYGKNGNVLRNVEVTFDNIRPAKYWQIVRGTTRYCLICDLNCYNWSCFSESIPVATKQVKIIPKEKKVKVEQKPELVQANKRPSLISRHSFSPDVEAWLYGGVSKGVDNNIGDTGRYYGVSVSAWIDKWRIGNGSFRIGPSYQYVGWDGIAGNVDYDGHFSLVGAEGQYLTATTKDQLKVLFGKKAGYVYGRGFPYYAHERAQLTAYEGAHQWWNQAKNYEAEIGFRAEIATNNKKSSTWENNPISKTDDPALDQSMYSVRGKYTWTRHKNFMPTLEIAGSYRASNHAKAIQIRPGLKLWDETIEPSIHYERGFVDGDQTGTVGANINIDLSKLGKKVFAWLSKSNKS